MLGFTRDSVILSFGVCAYVEDELMGMKATVNSALNQEKILNTNIAVQS